MNLKNKQIVILSPNDNLGGAEQYLKMIAEEFLRQGYSVDVFFLKRSESGAWSEIKDSKIKLHFTKQTREKYGIFSTLWKLVSNRKEEYEYVFTSHVHVNSYVSLLRKFKIIKAKKHIARESTSVFRRFTGLKLRVFKFHYLLNYGNIDLLICQTEYMRNQLIEGIPSLDKKTIVRTIPNPVDIKRLSANGSSIKTELENYIVSAGRLIPEKGYDILIDAFSIIKQDRKDLKLVILGEGQDRGMLEEKIKLLNLQGEVILKGFVNDVYPWFRGAEACVVSSRIEGFPNVLLQMMSQNNKVVSTLCAGGVEDIKGLVTAETNNVESLHNAITQCLDNDSTPNRALFDKELESRSVEKFLEKVEGYLNTLNHEA